MADRSFFAGGDAAQLERALADLGSHVVYPPTPDLVARVRLRLAQEPPRRQPFWRTGLSLQQRFGLALVVLLVVAGAVLAISPDVRTVVADRLGLRGVQITQQPGLPTLAPTVVATPSAATTGSPSPAAAVTESPSAVAAVTGPPPGATAVTGAPSAATAVTGSPPGVTAVAGSSPGVTALAGSPAGVASVTGTASPADGAVGRRLNLGQLMSLDEARASVGFQIEVPAVLGLPDEVYVQTSTPPGGQVALVYAPRPDLPQANTTGVGLLLTEFQGNVHTTPAFGKGLPSGTRLDEVQVNGERGLWVEGDPHFFFFLDARGQVQTETTRLAGNTLLWEHGSLTLRLEAVLPKDAALRIAGSVQ